MLTRQYYKMIADVIRNEAVLESTTAQDMKRKIAMSLCVVFTEDNPKFDPGKFLKACGEEIDE